MWGFKNSKNAETVHKRAIRYFLGVHTFTPIEGMYGDMGWATPQMRHHANMMRFWNRLVNMDDDRLTKKVFMWDWMLNKANWSSEMLTVLKVVLRLSTTFAPVLQHGRIATIVICLYTLRRASTRKLNRF